jgi:predicted RNase H-like HicB family nuclease
MPKQKRKPGKQNSGQNYLFAVVVEKDSDGYYVCCPALDGCFTQGDSYEGAIRNIGEAIALHIKARLEHREPIPTDELVSLAIVEVNV